MEELDECPVCENSTFSNFYSLPDTQFNNSKQEFQIVQCQECHLGMVNPRPTYSELSQYYPASYYSQDQDASGTSNSDDLSQKKFNWLPDKPGKLLDIGMRTGRFLDYASQQGWDVVGSDIKLSQDNYNFPVQETVAWELDFPENSFDCVTLWQVLEHISYPSETISKISELLKTGGELIIAVPNFSSPRSQLMKLEDVPRHLFMFNETSLKNLLESKGFEIETFDYSASVYEQSQSGLVTTLFKHRLLGKNLPDILHDFNNQPEQFESFPMKIIDRMITLPLRYILPLFKKSPYVIVKAENQ